jgi:beta-glucosidase
LKTADDVSITVTLKITNTGSVTGTEIVQAYAGIPEHPLFDENPSRALKGFSRVADLAPGKSVETKIVLGKYAFSNWEETKNLWNIRKGLHHVVVAASSVDVRWGTDVENERDLYWSGL